MDGNDGTDWGAVAASETHRAYLERSCRIEWPRLWLAIDAIAWIIARSDDEVDRLFEGNMPINGSAPRRASEIVEDIASRHARIGWGVGNTLFWAREQLASALCGARLSGWRWNKADDNLLKLPPDAYFKALSIHDTNSAGMFRMDSTSNMTDFLLLIPEEVRSLWPPDVATPTSRPVNGAKVDEEQKPLPEGELKRWVASLDQDALATDVDTKLWPLCKSAFPEHKVSRASFRKVIAGGTSEPRKRGPKAIRRKPTA